MMIGMEVLILCWAMKSGAVLRDLRVGIREMKI